MSENRVGGFLENFTYDVFRKKVLEGARAPNEEEKARAEFANLCGEFREKGMSVDDIKARIARVSPDHVKYVEDSIERYARGKGMDPGAFLKRGKLRPLRIFGPRKKKKDDSKKPDESVQSGELGASSEKHKPTPQGEETGQMASKSESVDVDDTVKNESESVSEKPKPPVQVSADNTPIGRLMGEFR